MVQVQEEEHRSNILYFCQMENYTPFAFYREFLDEEIYNELEKYEFEGTEVDLLEYYTDKNGQTFLLGEITKRDTKNYVIEYIDKGEKKIYSLENNVKDKLTSEINKTIQYIEKGFEARLMNPKEIEVFSQFLNRGLSIIKHKKAYSEFSFLEKYFNKIEEVISAYSTLNITDFPQIIINNNVYSYVLISENPTEIIEKLYTGLINQEPNPIISCSKEDFVNAFTGKEVKEGVKWLIVGKNKHTSKPSLFYFIDKLIDLGFISPNILSDYNKYIKYIFRDSNGNELKNIKQSRASFSNVPQDRYLIDNILSLL